MSNVQLKCICTYMENWYNTQVEIEMHFERRAEYPPDNPLAWRIITAPICLCKGLHKVVWIPVYDDPEKPVWFTQFELASDKPIEVDLIDWPPKRDQAPDSLRWEAIIENKGVEETTGFHYQFWFDHNENSSGVPWSSQVIMQYDPTIAVTPDPIEIPPKYPLATSGREESLEGGLGA